MIYLNLWLEGFYSPDGGMTGNTDHPHSNKNTSKTVQSYGHIVPRRGD